MLIIIIIYNVYIQTPDKYKHGYFFVLLSNHLIRIISSSATDNTID